MMKVFIGYYSKWNLDRWGASINNVTVLREGVKDFWKTILSPKKYKA
jgi:hypothetical protein